MTDWLDWVVERGSYCLDASVLLVREAIQLIQQHSTDQHLAKLQLPIQLQLPVQLL